MGQWGRCRRQCRSPRRTLCGLCGYTATIIATITTTTTTTIITKTTTTTQHTRLLQCALVSKAIRGGIVQREAVEATETMEAGDSCRAAFFLSLGKGLDWERADRRASRGVGPWGLVVTLVESS